MMKKEKYITLEISEKYVLESQEPSAWCGSRVFIVFQRSSNFRQEVYRSYYRRCAEKKFQKLTSGR